VLVPDRGRPDVARAVSLAPDAGPPVRPALHPPKTARQKAAERRARRARALEAGRRLLRKKKPAEARAQFSRALALKDDPQVRLLLSQAHESAGEYWPAMHHLKKAIARTERGGERLLDHLGALYLKVGHKNEACAAFRAALARQAGFEPAARHLRAHCTR
jgi:tetratricopeptide (TPR) repeat protein